ncbi:MAG TPA: 30S ribosomal protein S4 [Polyangiales bacterium]|nr:30S ribosomal protein S4 [Polyangiales bacterium]
MSRYTGPRVKIMRALAVDLPGLSPKTSDRRPYRPGQHGNARHKETEYGKRLLEKQKLRLNYGLNERQMRRLFREAARSKTNTGTKLIELLERRLDNAVYRAGFARSIPAARQLVNHGHILIDGKRVDIPSFRVRVGQTISLKTSSQQIDHVTKGVELWERRTLENNWLTVDRDARSAKVAQLPDETALEFKLNVQLVIELYALSA